MGTMAAGYGIVWIAVVGYVVWMQRRQQRLARQYEDLRKELQAQQDSEDSVSRAA